MADFIVFDEGADELNDNGWPATTYFLLSTKGVDAGTAHTAGESLGAADLGEITGTGYTRKSQATPASSSRDINFASMSWVTGSATDWPASVRSIVAATAADGSGVALCAWNLQTGGTPRDLSGADTTENVDPTYSL